MNKSKSTTPSRSMLDPITEELQETEPIDYSKYLIYKNMSPGTIMIKENEANEEGDEDGSYFSGWGKNSPVLFKSVKTRLARKRASSKKKVLAISGDIHEEKRQRNMCKAIREYRVSALKGNMQRESLENSINEVNINFYTLIKHSKHRIRAGDCSRDDSALFCC